MTTSVLRRGVINILKSKPSMYSSSLVLNVLGMQLYRTVFFYLWRKVRIPQYIKSEYQPFLTTLEKDGIVVIPNFFTETVYEKIKNEFSILVPKFTVSHSAIPLPHVTRMQLLDANVSSFFRSAFEENAIINELTTAYLNRSYHLPIDAVLTKIFCENEEELHSPKNGGTDNLHFDAPLRTLKAFYYVSDTTAENAALKYCVGSNKRNTLKRLWFEYKLSIRYALNKWNNNHGGSYADGEPWVVPTEEEKKKNNLVEKDMEVKGNTLVIVDIGGFHRRGELHSLKPRETIEINFRSVDTLLNVLHPIRRTLFPKKLLDKTV